MATDNNYVVKEKKSTHHSVHGFTIIYTKSLSATTPYTKKKQNANCVASLYRLIDLVIQLPSYLGLSSIKLKRFL